MASAQFLLGSNAGDLYAYALGAPTRGRRIYDPDYLLRNDSEGYAKLYRDAVIANALRYRRTLVAGRDWFLEPASPDPKDRAIATLLEALVKKIPRFTSARFNLAEAVLRGSTWARIYWRKETIRLHGDKVKRTWATIAAVQDAVKFRFRLMKTDNTPAERERASASADRSRPDPEPVLWRWEVYHPVATKWAAVDLREWIHHVYDDVEESLAHGRGLAESLYQYWMYKTAAFTYGEQFLDRWANGLVHIGIDQLRAQSVGTDVGPDARALTPQAKAQAWATELNKMRHQHVLAHDKADELGVLDAPAGAWGAALEALKYCDSAIRGLVIGADFMSEESGGGLNSSAPKVKENASEVYVGYDRVLLEETLTDQVVRRLWEINAPVFAEMGLGDAECPAFRIREEKRYDPLQRTQTAKALVEMGVQLRTDEVITQTGFTPPMPGEKVIGTGVPAGPPAVPSIGGLPGGPPGLGAPPPPPGAPPPAPPGSGEDREPGEAPGEANQSAPSEARELEEAPT